MCTVYCSKYSLPVLSKEILKNKYFGLICVYLVTFTYFPSKSFTQIHTSQNSEPEILIHLGLFTFLKNGSNLSVLKYHIYSLMCIIL